jgi:ABC-2 type transport system permease protein
MGMAGTDLAHHRRFVEAAEDHRRIINRQLNEHMTQHAGREAFDWKADPSFWSEVPEFVYEPPRVGAALERHALDLALLATWAIAGLVLAMVSPAFVRRQETGHR